MFSKSSNFSNSLSPEQSTLVGLEILFYKRWQQKVWLGSVAGPVIQATGRSEFEDGLGSGDFVSGYSYHMSVRTRLSDHTKQTKFQSQRPNDVETPVPSIWVQKCSNIGTVSTWMGDQLEWYPPSRKNADCSCWPPVLYHIVRNWSNDFGDVTRVHTQKWGFCN
jgi:hypothetical protein